MPLFKKKDKENDVKLDKDGKPIEIDEDLEEGLGSKILMAFVALLIILIWLAIIVLVIKSDLGEFGSTMLRPILKDVPYLSWMLPEENEIEESTEYQYDTINDAIERIQELEALLDAQLVANQEKDESIASLQAQIAELQVYKLEQDEFEKTKEKWYEEVVFSDEAPDIEGYKTYYESIDPENAEVLYKQVVEQLAYREKVEDYAKTYSSMKAKEAAAIFDAMENNLNLVADILSSMKAQARADILGKMDPEIAAKVTAIMDPN
jgi:flagellar motility protein MotE (MotC chaperone)